MTPQAAYEALQAHANKSKPLGPKEVIEALQAIKRWSDLAYRAGLTPQAEVTVTAILQSCLKLAGSNPLPGPPRMTVEALLCGPQHLKAAGFLRGGSPTSAPELCINKQMEGPAARQETD